MSGSSHISITDEDLHCSYIETQHCSEAGLYADVKAHSGGYCTNICLASVFSHKDEFH